MEYEWDPAKAGANRRKHGVRFSDAVLVFSDPTALTLIDFHTGEERFVTVGIDARRACWPWCGHGGEARPFD